MARARIGRATTIATSTALQKCSPACVAAPPLGFQRDATQAKMPTLTQSTHSLSRLLSGSDYVGRGHHHRGAHLDSCSELSCCGGKWRNILAISRPNMMQWSPGRPRAHDVGVVRQQHGSNDPGSGARSSEDCPWNPLWSSICGDSVQRGELRAERLFTQSHTRAYPGMP